MTYLVAITSCIVVPIAVGYLYGRKGINPDTPEGAAYYRMES